MVEIFFPKVFIVRQFNVGLRRTEEETEEAEEDKQIKKFVSQKQRQQEPFKGPIHTDKKEGGLHKSQGKLSFKVTIFPSSLSYVSCFIS